MLSNPITWRIILPVFISISLKLAQWFSTSRKACREAKQKKMVNLGKEIENDERWNEKKLGPFMNVFLNFDPHTTLDLFHPNDLKKWSNIKEIETWKVANRLWNGKMIQKWPMLKANLILRAKNEANADQVIW